MSQTNYFHIKTPTKSEIKSCLDNKSKFYIPPLVNCLYTLGNLAYVFQQNEFTKMISCASFVISGFHSMINHIYDTREGFLLQDDDRYVFITKEYDSTADLFIEVGRLFIGLLYISDLGSDSKVTHIAFAIITAALGLKSFFPSDPIFANYRYGRSFKIDDESINKKHFYDASEEGRLHKVFFYNKLLDNSSDGYECKSIDSNDLYDYSAYVETGVSKIFNEDLN